MVGKRYFKLIDIFVYSVLNYFSIIVLLTFLLVISHVHLTLSMSCSSDFIPDLYWKKTLTIHKMSFSLSLNASVYTSETQVCTQKCWSPVSTLLSKKSGSTLMCEWRCALLSLTLLPSSQYTNTIPQPSVWCGNSIHISCQPERFLSLIYVLHGWG